MKLICKFEYGSRLYGTNIENSDIDIRGVYIPEDDSIIGLKNNDKVIEIKEENKDIVYVSLKHFLNQILKGSPNYVEWLFVDNYIEKTKDWDLILKNKNFIIPFEITIVKFLMFIKSSYHSFKKSKNIKDAYNFYRLINEFKQIVLNHALKFPLSNCNYLKSIRTDIDPETINISYMEDSIDYCEKMMEHKSCDTFKITNYIYKQIILNNIDKIQEGNLDL